MQSAFWTFCIHVICIHVPLCMSTSVLSESCYVQNCCSGVSVTDMKHFLRVCDNNATKTKLKQA